MGDWIALILVIFMFFLAGWWLLFGARRSTRGSPDDETFLHYDDADVESDNGGDD